MEIGGVLDGLDGIQDSTEPASNPSSSTDGFHAFISYRRRDSAPVAHWIRTRLARFRPPDALLSELSLEQRQKFDRRRNFFLDTAFQAVNENFWTNRIAPALRNSRYLIVIASQGAFEPLADGSENWVVREIETFLEVHKDPGRIFLVLGPGGEASRLPPALTQASEHWDWVDLRGFKGVPQRWLSMQQMLLLERELMKIVAGLFDVPTLLIPVLTREQARDRTRIWTVATVTAVAILGALAFAATLALQQSITSQTLRAISLADTAQRMSDVGDHGTAAAVALEAMRRGAWFEAPVPDVPEAEAALARALTEMRERVVLRGHDAKVLALRFTADGSRVLSIAKDKTVRMWDATTGKELHRIDLSSEALAVSPLDGQGRAAVVDATGLTFAVDIQSGSKTALQQFPDAQLREAWGEASFSPSGEFVMLTISEEKGDRSASRVLIGQWRSGVVVADHPIPSQILERAWAPNGKYLVLGDKDGNVYRINTGGAPGLQLIGNVESTTRAQEIPKDKRSAVRALAVSADGRWLIAAGLQVKVWDTESKGDPVALPRAEASVVNAAINEDGSQVAVGRWDNCIELWEIQKPRPGKTVSPKQRTLLNSPCRRDIDYPLSISMLSFTASGELLSASDDRKAVIWDTRQGFAKAVLAGHGDRLTQVVASADGRRLATVSSGLSTSKHEIHLWSRDAALAPIVLDHDDRISIKSVAMTDDETLIATVTDEGLVRVWEAQSGTVRSQFDLKLKPTTLAFAAGGKLLFVAGEGRATLLRADAGASEPVWDQLDATMAVLAAVPGSGQPRAALVANRKGLQWIDLVGGMTRALPTESGLSTITLGDVSDDGRWLAYGDGKTIVVADGASGKTIQLLKPNKDTTRLRWSPRGDALMIATSQPAIEIWRPNSPLELRVHEHATTIDAIAFDAAGQRALARTAREVLVYDMTFDHVLAELGRAHGNQIRDARFSPDGTLVVTASDDTTARVWQASTGQLVRTLAGHGDFVASAQFTPDGRRLITSAIISENSVENDPTIGTSEAKIIIWDLASGKILAKLLGGADSVNDVLMSRGGHYLIPVNWAFEGATATLVWPFFATPEALIQKACVLHPRPLTAKQRHWLLKEENIIARSASACEP